ncbi:MULTISPECIES: LacI family DNA-binding transcriptional regulator [unclassified Streptomyces]|uniref:LacI family DNA-binding transcriptional regulator n=1 Tax=unclassified Streptomyces TaxID=2593676 RepID=UPI0037F711A8
MTAEPVPPGRADRRPSARRPTMKDIARRAGVSESAVSFALNDRPGVSDATRRRVRAVAEQLGWRASTAARALSGEGAATVGLVLARPANTLGLESFFLQLVSGLQEVLSARQLGLLFRVVEDGTEECAVYRRWWAEQRVDGVVVVDPHAGDPRPELLDSLGLPAVVIGTTPDGAAEHPGISTVWADDTAAMAAIARHLHALGHRRVVHVAGLPHLAHTARRIASLRAEAARLGLTAARSVTTDYSGDQGAEVTHRVLAGADPPTAIVYDNDVMAVAGAAVAARRGLSVPGDLSLVAFDDSPLCRATHPPLTALVRDTPGVGRHAAGELLALLDGGSARRSQVPTPTLCPRGSTGPRPL